MVYILPGALRHFIVIVTLTPFLVLCESDEWAGVIFVRMIVDRQGWVIYHFFQFLS